MGRETGVAVLSMVLLGCSPARRGADPSPPHTVDATPVAASAPVESRGSSSSSVAAVQPDHASPTSDEPPPATPAAAAPSYPEGPALHITRRVRTGVQPKSIALSPDGTRLFVCNFGFSGRRNVWVYDTAQLKRVGQIDFRGNAAEAIVSPDGETVYVSNFARGRIEVVDATSLEVTAEIKVGSNPKFMVIDAARQTLYVSNWSSRTVSAVDLVQQRVTRTMRTGRRPRGLALLDDGTLLVGAMWDHRVQVYGLQDVQPSRQFATCENPRHLMLSPDERRLYVSCSGERLLRWFDPATGEVLGEAPTGRNPRTIDVSTDGRFVAIADFSSSTISLVEPDAGVHRIHPVPRSDQIVGLAVAPGPSLRVYATSWLTNELIEFTADHTAVASR